MQLTIRTLGDVLLHIYDYPFETAIFLPESEQYTAETPCVVGWDEDEDSLFRRACLEHGLVNWLNVAVVSDTCDDAMEQHVPHLIRAFNEDCREGGWLRRMMNYCSRQE
jgi:hypothetical protein